MAVRVAFLEFRPNGTSENSPAIYRWETVDRIGQVLKGRLKPNSGGQLNCRVQPSFQDSLQLWLVSPSDKSLGYFRKSLRDKTNPDMYLTDGFPACFSNQTTHNWLSCSMADSASLHRIATRFHES